MTSLERKWGGMARRAAPAETSYYNEKKLRGAAEALTMWLVGDSGAAVRKLVSLGTSGVAVGESGADYNRLFDGLYTGIFQAIRDEVRGFRTRPF